MSKLCNSRISEIMKRKRCFLSVLAAFICISINSVYAGNLMQSQRFVRGKVVDKEGLPLIGVSIVEKGTGNGTVSDIQGVFGLTVLNTDPVLLFSYVGYKTAEILPGEKNHIHVVLQEELELLDEVVVVGYGTKRKGNLAASVSTVRNEDIIRSASTTTAGAIVGKMAGITSRQKSGTPGSSASLQIRNMGTPLYVIDGVMTDEGAFNNLDIHDIDNISVLKDGAAAIYGFKASNGVVLVTTKKGGKNQKQQVNINAYTGFQQWTEYPDLLNAYQWNYANDMADVNAGTLKDPLAIAAKKEALEKWRTGYYNAETGEDYRGYDWYGNFVDNAAPQSYVNANVNGGSENTTYYISVGHVSQDAVFKDYNFNRTNMTANFNVDLTDRWKIGVQVLGKIENRTNPALPGSDDYAEMRSSLYNLLPVWRPYANDNPDYLNFMAGHDAARNMAAYTIDNAGEFKETWRTVQPIFNIDYDIPVKGLKFKSLLSYYYGDKNTSNFEKGWKEYTYNQQGKVYEEKYDRVALGQTYLGKETEHVEELTGQTYLDFDRIFGNIHQVTATVGFEFYKRAWNSLIIYQTPANNTFISLLTDSENNKVINDALNYSTASWVFRAGYVYDQRYIIDFASRYDASWRFQQGNQWGFFPSLSGAWRISEEDFFKGSEISSWLSNLKLRVSYGSMGSDALSTGIYPYFAYLPGYNYDKGGAIITSNPISGGADNMVIGSQSKGLPVTNLTWIKTAITNVGIDLGFFDNHLTAEFDAFQRVRDGIPAYPDDVTYPLESGFLAMAQNLNSDKTLGVDGFIKWNDKIGDFTYSVGVNATLARQMNGKRYGELFLNAWDRYRWSQENRWANVQNGEIWMWETIGVFQTQEEIDNYPVNIDGANNTNLRPGDLIFRDINEDGIIDDFDKRPLGYAAADWPWDSSKGNKNPLLSFGLNLGVEWKGIDFAADLAGGSMNTFVPDWHVKYGPSRTQTGFVYNSLDVWHHEDIYDPTSPWVPGKFPAPAGWNNPSLRSWNDYYTKEINYVRLRNLVLGYTLPVKYTKKILIEKLRFYFEGSNLFCLDSLEDYGFDPEISTVTGFDYPQHRTCLFGINLTF
ncbi:MAG: SusC/RagA family TonB-linked outer membrane protein [Paludibacter sp. 47-17]|nr:MAG: SusC/RagA family TonB-linked outer membrane protein [Paludibacter sp. 47-17]